MMMMQEAALEVAMQHHSKAGDAGRCQARLVTADAVVCGWMDWKSKQYYCASCISEWGPEWVEQAHNKAEKHFFKKFPDDMCGPMVANNLCFEVMTC